VLSGALSDLKMLGGRSGALRGFYLWRLPSSPHPRIYVSSSSKTRRRLSGFLYSTCITMVGKWSPRTQGVLHYLFSFNGCSLRNLWPFDLPVHQLNMEPGANYRNLLRWRRHLLFLLPPWFALTASSSADRPKNWWPPHVAPCSLNDDPRMLSPCTAQNRPRQAYTPMDGESRTGNPPAFVFVLLCTRGINIFGIACMCLFGRDGFSRAGSSACDGLKATHIIKRHHRGAA